MLQLEKIISKKVLEDLYVNQKLSDFEIGSVYGVSYGRIHRLRNRYGIKAIEYYQRHSKQELDMQEKEFLIGVMLGDGHIRWRNKESTKTYPQLMLEQTTKHYEYVLWLKERIQGWIYDVNKPLRKAKKIINNKEHTSYPISTINHPVFIEFYKAFYNKDKKIIDIEFIKKYFSTLSLAVWIMDDGTNSNDRNLIICSHSFTQEENNILSKFLYEKYGLTSSIINSGKYYYLSFTKESSIKIKNIVKEYIVPSMMYKLVSSETTNGARIITNNNT